MPRSDTTVLAISRRIPLLHHRYKQTIQAILQAGTYEPVVRPDFGDLVDTATMAPGCKALTADLVCRVGSALHQWACYDDAQVRYTSLHQAMDGVGIVTLRLAHGRPLVS